MLKVLFAFLHFRHMLWSYCIEMFFEKKHKFNNNESQFNVSLRSDYLLYIAVVFCKKKAKLFFL